MTRACPIGTARAATRDGQGAPLRGRSACEQRDQDSGASRRVHRRGGCRCGDGTHAGGRDRRDLPRAWARPDPRRACGVDHGGDVREAGGLLTRSRRLDAPVRRAAPAVRRQRDRRGWPAARDRARARPQNAGTPAGDGLLRRRGGGRRRVPRDDEPRCSVELAGAVLLRDKPLRDGHGDRALRVRD